MLFCFPRRHVKKLSNLSVQKLRLLEGKHKSCVLMWHKFRFQNNVKKNYKDRVKKMHRMHNLKKILKPWEMHHIQQVLFCKDRINNTFSKYISRVINALDKSFLVSLCTYVTLFLCSPKQFNTSMSKMLFLSQEKFFHFNSIDSSIPASNL